MSTQRGGEWEGHEVSGDTGRGFPRSVAGGDPDFYQAYRLLTGELDRAGDLQRAGKPQEARTRLEAARDLIADVMEDGPEFLEFYPLRARIFAALGDELSARDTWRELLLLTEATECPDAREHRKLALEALGMPADEV